MVPQVATGGEILVAPLTPIVGGSVEHVLLEVFLGAEAAIVVVAVGHFAMLVEGDDEG